MKPADPPEALVRLGLRYGLDEHRQEQLVTVLGCLGEDERAPTTIRDPGRAVDIHLADSLVALELEAVRAAARIVDVGAGAGFPGVPLAVALPQSQVTLLDSQARKCAFIERMAEAAGVQNARVVCARAEEWGEGVGAHDIVLARALAPQPVVLEYAAPLLRLGGALVDWRGQREEAEEARAIAAAAELGLERQAVHHVTPFEGAHSHHLHVYEKLRPTPDRFPRRAGMARKRPLA